MLSIGLYQCNLWMVICGRINKSVSFLLHECLFKKNMYKKNEKYYSLVIFLLFFFLSFFTETSKRREQFWQTIHKWKDRFNTHRQVVYDEPRSDRILRVLFPQPWIRAARIDRQMVKMKSQISNWILRKTNLLTKTFLVKKLFVFSESNLFSKLIFFCLLIILLVSCFFSFVVMIIIYWYEGFFFQNSHTELHDITYTSICYFLLEKLLRDKFFKNSLL